ncbi:hypothetical protein E1301_Tti021855 [Triplophysa tibetana]|uniref:Uncharacterized protein n=1 Tax=Triplophysa tibetana TaxID=1572043 RepID=A0A5A9NCJ0_9TELE|nr:hypothetical protein E1301_Tti021855 [Triplophysa tibetana]
MGEYKHASLVEPPGDPGSPPQTDSGWSSAAVFMYRFSGPKTLLSSGWRRCEQWGGKESRTMPFDRQNSIASTERCDQLLLRRRKHLRLQGHTSMSDKVLEKGQKAYVLHLP